MRKFLKKLITGEKTLKARIYLTNNKYRDEDINLINEEEGYRTSKSKIPLGNINHKHLIEDKKGNPIYEIYSPDLKTFTVMKRNFETGAIDYLIPEVGNHYKNKMEGIKEEIFLKSWFLKHSAEIIALLTAFFLLSGFYYLNNSNIGQSIGQLSNVCRGLVEVLNTTKALPL